MVSVKHCLAKLIRSPYFNFCYEILFRTHSFLGLPGNLPFIINRKVVIDVDSQNSFNINPMGYDPIGAKMWLMGFDSFENETLKIFTEKIKGKNVFMDIGANTGVYSLVARALNPTIEIHSFEPVPEIFDALSSNLKLNPGSEKSHCHLLALSDYSGKTEFDIPVSINFASGGSMDLAHRPHTRRISCDVTTLDAFCQSHKIEKIDVIKMDTENTETAVIQGGLQIIGASRPIIFIEILTNQTGEAVEDLLSPFGYEFYHLTDQGAVRCEKLTAKNHFLNHLLIPKNL